MTFTTGTEIKAAKIHFFGKTVNQGESLLLVRTIPMQENDARIIGVLLVLDQGGIEDFVELVGCFKVNMLEMGIFGEFID